MNECYHCGLPADPKISSLCAGELQTFCCQGCKAVANLIYDSGSQKYYSYREGPTGTPASVLEDLKIYDDPLFNSNFVSPLDEDQAVNTSRARIKLYGISCSACAWLIENHLEKLAAVNSARVNYSQRMLQLDWDQTKLPLSKVLGAVYDLGFSVAPDHESLNSNLSDQEGKELLLRLGVSGIGMMQVGMYAIASYLDVVDGMSQSMETLMRSASLFIATLVIFFAAQPFFKGAFRAINGLHLTMDVPVAIALTLAYGSSLYATWTNIGDVYFDAVCMFCFFLLLSRYFEFLARSRWQNTGLDTLNSSQAWLLDEHSVPKAILLSRLQPGDHILVKAGETVPTDACLLSNVSELNQALITGEFTPLKMTAGATIFSGAVNAGGPIQLKVLRTAQHSALNKIKSITEQAQFHKPIIASLADRLAGWFVGGVLLIAATCYVIWFQIDPDKAFWITLSVLVVSCPCALSLATPTALTVIMQSWRENGILVQNPDALETLSRVDTVLFDKTGTLTTGRYEIIEFSDLNGCGKQVQLNRAASIERPSSHPISHAFSDYPADLSYDQWKSYDGRGIECLLEGKRTRIGDLDFVLEITGPLVSTKQNQADGKRLYLGQDEQMLAEFILNDRLRPEASSLIDYLRPLDIQLFSGDPSPEVSKIAKQLGLSKWQNAMSPSDKFAGLQRLQASGGIVLAVGDGLNDAPLLAAADISVAVAKAVDLSKQRADFIFLSDDLHSIRLLFEGAKRVRRIITQNLFWALTYNLVAIPMAATGLIEPWMAALGMSASSALVVLNAFRAKSPMKKQSIAFNPVVATP